MMKEGIVIAFAIVVSYILVTGIVINQTTVQGTEFLLVDSEQIDNFGFTSMCGGNGAHMVTGSDGYDINLSTSEYFPDDWTLNITTGNWFGGGVGNFYIYEINSTDFGTAGTSSQTNQLTYPVEVNDGEYTYALHQNTVTKLSNGERVYLRFIPDANFNGWDICMMDSTNEPYVFGVFEYEDGIPLGTSEPLVLLFPALIGIIGIFILLRKL